MEYHDMFMHMIPWDFSLLDEAKKRREMIMQDSEEKIADLEQKLRSMAFY